MTSVLGRNVYYLKVIEGLSDSRSDGQTHVIYKFCNDHRFNFVCLLFSSSMRVQNIAFSD